MLASWVCWQLFLGWPLLLGQPVFGDPDATEELSLQESEEVVLVSQEQEEPVPVLQDLEESVPMSQEPVPELEEPEEREPTSDEKLEMEENEDRKWLQEELAIPLNYEMQDIHSTILEHYHKYSEEYYRPFENANLRTEKAIGTMLYLHMTLAKTNCTNDLQAKEEDSDHRYYYRLYHADRYPRNCEPLSGSEEEKQDCKFTFFEDARDPGKPFVIDQECYTLTKEFGRRMFLPR